MIKEEWKQEWKEKFRMSKTSLLKLAEELGPYIEEKETIIHSPVDVVKQVALTLLLKRRKSTLKDGQFFWSFKTGH